jgi:hypothetical protein
VLTKEQCLDKALDLELRADPYAESKAAYLRMAAHWHRLAVVAEHPDATQPQDGAI